MFQVPAVYYAHLASNRARSHENHPASDGPRGGQKFEEMRQDQAQAMRAAAASGLGPTSHSGSRPPLPPTEAIPLVPLGNDQMNGNMIVVLRTGMCQYPSSFIDKSSTDNHRVHLRNTT
jgi:eukaryotic translation initiation factor 2C